MNTIPRTIQLSFPISWRVWTGYMLLFLVLCVVLPLGFHQIGLGGRQFLPMHIPALLAGFLAGPVSGVIVGMLGPILSHSITGMPPLDRVGLMSVELAVYGLIAGIAYYQLRQNVFVSLVAALIGGRLAFGVTLWVLEQSTGAPYSAASWFSSAGAMVTGWPGVLIQLFAVPAIVIGLNRRKT